MNTEKSQFPGEANDEVSALIATLHETGRRLEELTAGEVDTVADRDGRTFVLRRAQEQLRHIEAAKQAAILNALPAHIALLDTQGRIVAVNEAWRRFGSANVLHGAEYGIGLNYLEIFDNARGDDASEARQVAEGIRSVLEGRAKSFSIEYPCHSPTEQHWFLLTVTPLADAGPNGAVVMHSNITERKREEQARLESEEHFRFLNDLAEATRTLAEPVQIMAVMSRMLGEHLRASRCAYADVENDGEQFTILHDYTDSCASTVGSYHLSLFGARAVATLKNGQILVIRSVEAELLPGEGADMFNAIGIKAIITCPLVKDGALRAMMAVHQTTPRDWTPGEVATVQHVVERCWATIERRTAEEKLRQSETELHERERRISDMLGSIEMVSLMLDTNARITYCNDYLLRLTGWQREEVLGQDWFAFFIPPELFIPPKINDLHDVHAALLANKPEAMHHENEILTRSGERRLIRWNNSVLRSGAGDVIGTASIGEDITERKAADEVLKKRAADLERFHRLSVGRELQMIELKKQVNELARQAGQKPPYDLAFAGPQP